MYNVLCINHCIDVVIVCIDVVIVVSVVIVVIDVSVVIDTPFKRRLQSNCCILHLFAFRMRKGGLQSHSNTPTTWAF